MLFHRIVTYLALLIALVGCSYSNHSSVEPVPVTTLNEAKTLLLTGRVIRVYQPHVGRVGIILVDGSSALFKQPHLDWIVSYIDDNDLTDEIEIMMQ